MKKTKLLTKEEIINTINERRADINRFKVNKIGIFGSFAKGEKNQKSDIDLFIDFEEPSFDNYMSLLNFLQKMFDRKVDIINPCRN